jgi:predicted nucleotidyltransferase
MRTTRANPTPSVPTADDPRLAAIAARLKERYGAERVILFGSVARGQATTDSDVDLLVVAPSNGPRYQRIAAVLRLLRDLSRGLPLEPVVLTAEELRQRLVLGDQFIEEILHTGREL